MSEERTIDAGGYAKPGSRIERALREKGFFIPRKAMEELNDALGAIDIESNKYYTEWLHQAKLEPGNHNASFNLKLPFKGGLGMPLEGFESIAASLQDYIRNHPECGVTLNEKYMTLEGNDFRTMLEVVNEGFIKKVSPHNAIDLDEAFAEPETSKWTCRTGR